MNMQLNYTSVQEVTLIDRVDTVTGKTYACTVLPPVASAPTNVTAVQEGLTSIRVSWSPPTPLGNTTGYRIYYSGHSSRSSSEDVSGGSIENYLLTGLQSETTYTISIGGTSRHFPSDSVVQDVTLGESYLTLLSSCHG